MWATIRQKLIEWYILIIPLCILIPVLFFASYDRARPQNFSTEATSSQSDKAPAPARSSTAQSAHQSGPAPSQTNPKAASTPAVPRENATKSTTPPPPAPSQAVPVTHDPVLAENVGQTPPSVAAAGGGTIANGRSSPTSIAVAGGDAAAGRQVFRKCQACHSLEPSKNMLGPSLAGVIGRKAGSEANYNYSPAMKQSNITWDAKSLEAYLADPQKTVPGNKMPFPGLKTDHDRADIIAFLAAGAQPAPPAPKSADQPASGATAQKTPAPSSQGPQRAAGEDKRYIPDAKYTGR